MKNFIIKNYTITSNKLPENSSVRLALLADLHGIVYGENHKILLESIYREKPDVLLAAGDMVIKNEAASCMRVKPLFQMLAHKLPVYYSLGNHEYKMMLSENGAKDYLLYEQELKEAGVCFLHNEKAAAKIRGIDFVFYGLELPMIYYKKPRSPRLSEREMEKLLGTPDKDAFTVLLAHNPKYGGTYFSWGADLTLSGHYHGGIVRLSEHHGLSCPQYLFLPPYCCGDFHKYGRHMIVSPGIGEHTIPVRIHNPRELLMITIKGLPK